MCPVAFVCTADNFITTVNLAAYNTVFLWFDRPTICILPASILANVWLLALSLDSCCVVVLCRNCSGLPANS